MNLDKQGVQPHHPAHGHTLQGGCHHQTPHHPLQGGSREDLMPREECHCTSWPERSTF